MIGEPYMIKIAFFDIDGTLLKMGCKEPTDKTVKALNSLRQNGILLCMATGRGYLSIPKFKDITFDVLLTFNGSYVMAGEKIIFRNPLNNNDKHQIIQNLNKMDRAAAISNEHFIVTNGTDQDLEQYFRFGNEILTIAENFGFGGQFYVNLQTNDGLILFAHVTVPPFLPVLPSPALHRFCCTRKHSLRG